MTLRRGLTADGRAGGRAEFKGLYGADWPHRQEEAQGDAYHCTIIYLSLHLSH